MCDDLGTEFSSDIDTSDTGDFSDGLDTASDASFSDEIEDIPEDDFSDDMVDVSDDLPENDFEDEMVDVSDDLPEDDFEDDMVDVSDDLPEDDFEDDMVDVSDDLPEDDFEDDMVDVSDDLPDDDFEDDMVDVSDNLPEDDFEDNMVDVSDDLPEDDFEDDMVDVSDDTPENEVADDMVDKPDNVSEDTSFNNSFDDKIPETEMSNIDTTDADGNYLNDTSIASMSDEELGNFTDWENAYASEIDNIKNDPTLSDLEKSELLQASYNDFVESNGNNYSDADIEDGGYAKVLTKNPDEFNSVDNQNDLLSDATADISPIRDIDNWLGDINPNFDEFDTDSPYCNNCGSCAYAVWKRLEGDNDICASVDNIGYNDEMEALTGMEQVSMSPDEIENNLLAQGDGAHAIIGIDRAEGRPGHWFNAACIDGKVVAIDGQSGEILDWPPDYGDVVNWEMSVKKG